MEQASVEPVAAKAGLSQPSRLGAFGSLVAFTVTRAIDVYGNPRILGTRPDIGATEGVLSFLLMIR